MSEPADKKKKNLLQRAIGFLTDAVKWITEQLEEEEVRNAIYGDLGLTPPPLGTKFPDVKDHLASIDAYREKSKPDAEALKAAVEDIKAIRQVIRNFVHASQGGELPDAIFDSLIRLMTTNYLRLRLPIVYWIGQPLGFVGDAMAIGAIPKEASTGFVAFIKDPIEHFEKLYGKLETEDDARRLSHAIFAPLGIAFAMFQKRIVGDRDVDQLYGWEPDIDSTTPVGDAISNRTLSISYVKAKPEGFPAVEGTVLASLALVPGEQGGPGLFVSLGGAVALESKVDGWKLKSKLGSASAFSMLVTDWDSVSGPADASVEFTIAREPDPSGLPYSLDLGSRARLDLGDFAFSAGLGSGGPTLRLATGKSAFVLEAKSDAVVERGMPPDADVFQLDFDLALGMQNGKFFFEGGSTLQTTLPASKKLGPVQARGLTLGLTPSTDPAKPALSFDITSTLVITLGPCLLTVDRIGMSVTISQDGDPGASFHPPNGVGVVIGSDVVKGGGYISFDAAAHQYAGVLELSIKDKLTLKAIGILNTRINGQPAFSFLIIITATGFTPISLGLGFKLTGVGGLLGLDREVNIDRLEAGIKDKTLDRILFPPDPVANSAEIVTACSNVFPPKRGQTIFGPMVQISWGASQLVRMELAVVVQIPSVRLVIMGKLRALFPNKDAPVLKIEVNLVGDFDFDRRRAFARATLVASKLAGFTLNGDAAMLLYWGDNSTYIISFGGFNKRYLPQVPAEFPKLSRLSIALAEKDNLTLKIEAYCAITSNSFQIGGSLTAVAKKGKFSIEGAITVDALFQSGEPCFIFDLVGKVQLKAFGVNLFMVKIEGTLMGANPWHVTGKVTFEIWIFDYSIHIDHSWGGDSPSQQLPAVDVAALVRAEIADVRNWTADLPPAAQSLVTLKQGTGTEVVFHPLGTLNIVQRVAPLGVNITRFGESKPQGQTLFGIEKVSVGASAAPVENVREQFARAQFIEMTQDEKLATPAFERMNAGVRIGAADLRNGPVVEATTEYTTLVWDAATNTARPDAPYTLKADTLSAFTAIGPAAKAAELRSSGARFRGPSRAVQVGSLSYRIATTDDQSAPKVPALPAGSTESFTVAASALRTYLAANPLQRGKLQVLPMADKGL